MQYPHPLPALRTQLVAELKEQLRRLEGAKRPPDEAPVSTACRELDQLLPEGGLRRGTLVEWLAAEGGGAGSLAVAVAAGASGAGGALVVIDATEQFYPPAAARAGIDLANTILVRPQGQSDEMWALDQALRSAGVAAVLCWIDRLAARDFRRLQLAAEAAAGLGLLVRPAAAHDEPSWADVRFFVTPLVDHVVSEPIQKIPPHPALSHQGRGFLIPAAPLPTSRRLRVELLRLRGAPAGQTVELEIDDETGVVRLAAALAAGTTARRAAGA